MALKNAKNHGQTVAAEALKIDTLEVTRAKEFNSGAVGFDCIVNGIKIYGMTYRTVQDKGSGKEVPFIGFPARKGDDGKYYSYVWFKISDEDVSRFEDLIDKALK